MAPRRSARISAVPDQKSTETEAPRTNGVTKRSNGKSATKKKETNSEKDPKKVGSDKIAAIEEVFEVPATPKKKTGQVSEPPLDRPVLPQRSNATLMTPRGSSVVAYPAGAEDVSPSKSGLPRPVATTGNLLEKALAHLIATDERLRPIIEQHHCRIFSPEGLAEQIDPFEALTSSIIGQQVSGAAAKSIKNKFVGLFHNDSDGQKADRRRFPMPAEVAKLDIATLRTAGLSQRKAEYIQGLAEKFVSGELSAQNLLTATDDEVMEMLIAVRGLGKWSVEMFSCFALKRTDVFSTGDLGVQRGCAAFVGRDVNKLKAKGGGKFKYMQEQDMLDLAENFRPYRSLFMWYMWRVEDVDITVMTA